MRIVINFKNTEEDIKLYEELKRHSSISGYIKDILKGNFIKIDIKLLDDNKRKFEIER